MKNNLAILIFLFVSGVTFCQPDTTHQFPAGIVYGPKAAFKINAPEGWVLDNQSGMVEDLPCVLYLKSYTWENSPAVMFPDIAPRKFKTMEKFIAYNNEDYQKSALHVKQTEIKRGNAGGHDYIVYDYQFVDEWARIVYFQLPDAVGYVVFSAGSETDFTDYADDLYDVIKSFQYLADVKKHVRGS